jgi:hypothetical protein
MRSGQAAADRAGLHSAIEAGLKRGGFALGQNRKRLRMYSYSQHQ